MNRTAATTLLLAVMVVIAAYVAVQLASAAPTGATIISNTTAGTPTYAPGSLTNDRGTITTVILSALQQDQYWKAYIGNITGKLILADANSNNIYDWPFSVGSKQGEVYMSRASSPVFTTVTCANANNITAEETFNNMTPAQSDTITKTFNYTSHHAFFVGIVPITANTCDSTATYVNSSIQNMGGNQNFQEVLLQDNTSNVIFVTLVNNSQYGYNNLTYDFQALVPESGVKPTPTTYYFWTEMG
jgi:hypothetical protein